MFAVCKKTTRSRIEFGNFLLFIKNKKYYYQPSKHIKICCETTYEFSCKKTTFNEIFYTNKELRKLKLIKLKL